MSLAQPDAGVAKALFSSPPRDRPLPPPTTTTTNAATTTTASSATATAVGTPALPAECVAKVNGLITDDLRQLSRDDLDVRRWLNATLSRVLEGAKDTAATQAGEANTKATAARRSLQLEEQLVHLLHARVQTHRQELSSGIDDLISNTLVRLPRTTMELGRMATEAEELTGQLQVIEAIVQPGVGTAADTYVAQLHTRNASEVKLRRCTRLLEKAARVQESLRNIQYLIDHREAAAGSRKGEALSRESSAAAAGETDGKAAATRQRDLDEVAGIIRQAREDLLEITAVEDTFGEQHRAQLEQFEQYIEHAIEEECVGCLRAHQLERGTRLITTLHSIGRADAVLKRYGEQAAAHMVAQQEARLREAVVSGGKDTRGSAAAAVAELLRRTIIPDDGDFLSRELVFLSRLVRGAAAALSATGDAAKTGKAAREDASATPLRTTAASGAGASSSTAAAGSSSSTAVDDDPCAAQVLEVLGVLLSKLHEPVQAALQPLLTERPDTTTEDFVACFAAIQQLKVSASSTAVAEVTAAGATAATAKDPLEKLSREVTHRALVRFASLFHEERVLERYTDRLCAAVSAYCAQPLANLLASGASSPSPPTSSPSSRLATADESLADVLTHAVQEVLLYAPKKISARCTTAWHAVLSKALTQQLQPTAHTSQHVLLQHLYFHKQRVKPLLAKTQQAVEDWLSSGTTHERYPTSAGLLRADLLTRLWTPLRREVEEVQRATQQRILDGITRPIVAKIENYTALPCWGNEVSTQADSSAAAARTTALYTQGQSAPSSAVRDMGEMLMELPLTLETLASTAVTETYQGGQAPHPHSAAVLTAANDAEVEEGVRLLIDELAEEWLETVVHDVVRTFLDDKVLPLAIGPFAHALSHHATPPGESQTTASGNDAVTQLYNMALEQLATDLDYLRNILSAVNEESQETVEGVMSALRALPSTQQGRFVVGEALHMTSSSAGPIGDGEAMTGAAAHHGGPE